MDSFSHLLVGRTTRRGKVFSPYDLGHPPFMEGTDAEVPQLLLHAIGQDASHSEVSSQSLLLPQTETETDLEQPNSSPNSPTKTTDADVPFFVGDDSAIDSLLIKAFQRLELPPDISPLSTPPSSPPTSPRQSPWASPLSSPQSSPASSPQRMPIVGDYEPDELILEKSAVVAPNDRHTPENPAGSSFPKPKRRRKRRPNKTLDKQHGHEVRARKRRENSLAKCRDVKVVARHAIRTSLLQKAVLVRSAIPDTSLQPTSSGYLGARDDLPIVDDGLGVERRIFQLDELCGSGSLGFTLHRHDPSRPNLILHSETKSVMGLVAPVEDEGFNANQKEVSSMIERLHRRCKFKKGRISKTQRRLAELGLGGPHVLDPRRGVFDHLSYGISFGNGQEAPKMFTHCERNTKVLNTIRNAQCFRRLAGFLCVVFLTWAPMLFQYYLTTTMALLAQYPFLHLPFEECIFSAFTINFGPATACFPHRDTKNLAFGWCSITALGDFDWRKGGHLVLWDLKLVIEFPPGTTIFIPSALLCHSNTALQPGEKRYSFAMYSAGGLFRWVDHGFQLETTYQKTLTAAQSALDGAKRWASGLAMFSMVDELRGDVDA